MKKPILLTLAAVTALAVFGVAASAKNSPQVTIAASAPVVTFGESVTLTGSVQAQAAAQPNAVEVLANPVGHPGGYATIASVAVTDSSSAAGSAAPAMGWTFTASPTIETSYKAKWGDATSRPVTVKVRPQLTLAQVGLTAAHVGNGNRGTFSVKAVAGRSFAGKFVLIERRVPNGKLEPKKVVLGDESSATFTIRIRRGTTRLHAVMPTSQTGAGYVAGKSAVLTIHR